MLFIFTFPCLHLVYYIIQDFDKLYYTVGKHTAYNLAGLFTSYIVSSFCVVTFKNHVIFFYSTVLYNWDSWFGSQWVMEYHSCFLPSIFFFPKEDIEIMQLKFVYWALSFQNNCSIVLMLHSLLQFHANYCNLMLPLLQQLCFLLNCGTSFRILYKCRVLVSWDYVGVGVYVNYCIRLCNSCKCLHILIQLNLGICMNNECTCLFFFF